MEAIDQQLHRLRSVGSHEAETGRLGPSMARDLLYYFNIYPVKNLPASHPVKKRPTSSITIESIYATKTGYDSNQKVFMRRRTDESASTRCPREPLQ